MQWILNPQFRAYYDTLNKGNFSKHAPGIRQNIFQRNERVIGDDGKYTNFQSLTYSIFQLLT